MIQRELAALRSRAVAALGEPAEKIERFADVRFRGQSHELSVAFKRPARGEIERQFLHEYARVYGQVPAGRAMEVVTLRIRASGAAPAVALPQLEPDAGGWEMPAEVVAPDGNAIQVVACDRGALLNHGPTPGPLLLIDPEATTLITTGWQATPREDGAIVLVRAE